MFKNCGAFLRSFAQAERGNSRNLSATSAMLKYYDKSDVNSPENQRKIQNIKLEMGFLYKYADSCPDPEDVPHTEFVKILPMHPIRRIHYYGVLQRRLFFAKLKADRENVMLRERNEEESKIEHCRFGLCHR